MTRKRIARTPADFQRQLREQFDHLTTSAELYDQGRTAEAKRLALTLRLLLHDGGTSSRSLLGQMKLRETRPFPNTSSRRPEATLKTATYAGLVGMFLGGGVAKFVPHLATVLRQPISFEQWWSMPVLVDTHQREMTRKDLILSVADQDGGAHVDPTLDEFYADISRGNAMGRMSSADGTHWDPIPGVELASVRQVAHEVLLAFGYDYTPPTDRPSGIVMGGFKIHGVGEDGTVVEEEFP